MHAVRDLRVLLRLRDFRSLLAVRLLSQAADGAFQVALATYVVFSPEKQTSPEAIASALAVLLLPYSLLGPFTGVLLDRWRRRQVLLYGNLLRTLLAAATAALIVAHVPDWLFYVSALSVMAVNRFVLAGISASLPRVVDGEQQLVMANSIAPTAGTLAATAGGGLAFAVRLAGSQVDAFVVLLASALYFWSALTALRMTPELLGPDPSRLQPHVREALLSTVRGLVEGLRHLRERRTPAHALAAMTLIRFCYGALTVTVLMLCRYSWATTESHGLALLGITLLVSGVGFFAAALVTPWMVERLGPFGWIAGCAAMGAVLIPSLGLFFAPEPMLTAAFLLGLTTQGTKISTDTVVQSSVDDAFRGRVFAIYDVLFNVAFVGAAAVAALMLPPSGRSVVLLVVVTVLYALVAAALARSGWRSALRRRR
ncbi:MFS transporter [Streptomyces natalensis]|uniref:MFS transporter n=1 Tax=Streptomyces natalensis ATCC 27448 TaxID=1240678 RepID=A0A0D7CT22_9ACTN|nr:MFS transporter [Streptomyces natalensis]KIZ19378.1 MFS transporter [Streptomyces natalensis ATCC 27448]